MWKYKQSSFVGGRLDAELMGRQDLAQYYKGASELKNFLVRRQGYVSKRRGTDFVCDLKNLLGSVYDEETGTYSHSPVETIKVIPLVHEKDRGYYILASKNRAFLCSKDGIRLMNGEYAKRIDDSFTYTDADGNEKTKHYLADEEYNAPQETEEVEQEYSGDQPFSIKTKGYATLQAAFSDALPYDVIKMHQDVTVTTASTLTHPYTVELDLNGHNLISTATAADIITVNGTDDTTLVLSNTGKYKDDAGNYIGIKRTVSASQPCVSAAKGNVICNKRVCIIVSNAQAANAAGRFCLNGLAGTSITINGGYYESIGDNVRMQDATCSLTINGGYFKSTSLGTTVWTTSGQDVVVNDGLFVATGSNANGLIPSGNATKSVIVNGGTFINESTNASSKIFNDYVTVNGGYFECQKGFFANSNVTVNGGTIKCANRPFYSAFVFNGGRLIYTNTAAALDLYYADNNYWYRGEIALSQTVTTIAELTNSANRANAGLSVEKTVTIDDVEYKLRSYKQPDEEDYVYNETYVRYNPEDGFVQEPSTTPPAEGDGETEKVKDIPVAQDRRPFYIPVPYTNSELADMDYCQSGDTVFLAHPNHAPGKIVFGDNEISYSRLDFASKMWKRPAIVNVQPKGFKGTGTARNVEYVCTYVKNGIESIPSEPVSASYSLPWNEEALMEITCSRGNNIEPPDYYNIYKRDTSEFGAIATVGHPQKVYIQPLSYEGSVVPYTRQVYDSYPDQELKKSIDFFYSYHSKIFNGYNLYYFVDVLGGAVVSDGVLVMDFGKSSTQISTFELQLDAFECEYRNLPDRSIYKYNRYGTSTFITAVARFTVPSADETKDDTEVILVQKIKCALTDYEPVTIVDRKTSATPEINPNIEYLNRSAIFDFTDQIKNDKTLSSSQTWQIESITVSFYDDETNRNLVPGYFHGMRFTNKFAQGNVFEDDYITPDLSLTPPVDGNHFEERGDYPSCVGIYKQRLAFASTENDPFMFWLSCVGDLYNFNTHATIREDDAVSASLAATEFPRINHIIVNRDLMLLADSGEWKVAPITGNTLSYKTLSADMQSAIGCAKSLKPLNVGDEIVFVKQTGETLLATRYNFTSDGYETMDLTVLSQWIFRNNPIVQMAYKQHPDSTIECVLADGTVASLVYMKEHEVCAWSRHEFGGGWKARGVATSKALSNGTTETVFLVERDGEYRLWKVRDDIPVRSSRTPAQDHLCMDGMREVGNAEDGEVVVQVGDKRYAGYVFDAELVTVRPEPQGGAESIQFELKNAKDAEVRILDGGDFTMKPYGAAEQYAQKAVTGGGAIDTDGNIALATKDVRLALAGSNNGDGRVELRSSTPYPLNILSVAVNYEIQPLSGSEG